MSNFDKKTLKNLKKQLTANQLAEREAEKEATQKNIQAIRIVYNVQRVSA